MVCFSGRKYMPILTLALEGLIIALVTIVYGVRWECYYTAWISVVMNIVFTTVLLASVDLPTEITVILIVYVAIGVVSAWRNWRVLFNLFGAKTFGALSLTVALANWSLLSWTHDLWKAISGSYYFNVQHLSESAIEYLLTWVCITVLVQIIGLLVKKRRKTEHVLGGNHL